MIDKEKIKNQENSAESGDSCSDEQGCCSDDAQTEILNDTITNLQNTLNACNAKSKEWQELYLRVMSDFQNFKVRTVKEQATWRQATLAEVLGQLLTIVDDFDRAFADTKTENEHDAKELAGFVMIHKAITKLLEKFGVKPMPHYETFNPQYHEAIMQVNSPEYTSGTIVQVLQKGYLLHDTVLRPAKVSVAQ